MKLRTTFTLLFLIFALYGNAQVKSKFTPQLNVVKETFGKKNMGKLKPILADGYSVNGISKGSENMVLVQLFEQFPICEKYTVSSQKKEGKNTRIAIKFFFKKEPLNSNILFDDKGKIKELNILDDASIEEKN